MNKILVEKEALEKKLAQAPQGSLIEIAIIPAQMDQTEIHSAFLHVASVHNGTYYDLESLDEYLAYSITKTA